MDPKKLFDLMSEYFGERGIFLLRTVMDELEFSKLSGLDDEERRVLVKALVEDVFRPALSTVKLVVVQQQLASILNVSKFFEAKEHDYLSMG
jgi:hypothetical protein